MTGGVLREESLRPSLSQAVRRGLVVVAVNASTLVLLDRLVTGLSVDHWTDAVLAGLAIGLVNALVWPALAFAVVPLSVLTLGAGSVVINALLIALLLERFPGVELAGFGTALVITVAVTVATTLVAALLALDDDAWFDQRMIRRARRSRGGAPDDPPGVVVVQVDGLAEPVLRRALAAGDTPTLHRWIHEGSHRLHRWETEWSSQTGVGQCGILHGSIVDMPAFRWVDKQAGALMVSNHPSSAAAIERAHSDGRGLLAHRGSSYGNLFSGDAERAVMTMSGAGRVKEGRIGSGYGAYFSRPGNVVRTATRAAADVWRERRAAADQRRRGVEPRVPRSRTYMMLRAFTTVVSRDVCVNGVLGDMAEGRAVIYVNLLGYDEVSHHSGPERSDTLAVLRDIDRQIHRIERAAMWTRRRYHVVVLSDHGQTQGATFSQRFGETLEQLVERLIGSAAITDPDSAAGNTESVAWLRGVRGSDAPAAALELDAEPIVLASGSLGLIYLPGPERRLTEEEIDATVPGLIDGLRRHPGIGFVLVAAADGDGRVLGPRGHRVLSQLGAEHDRVEGDDPLAVYGPHAVEKVRRAHRYRTVADIMVNAVYDPHADEICAFEEQVGSHGGLGGAQEHAFLLAPTAVSQPTAPLLGPVAVHTTIKGWLAELGHPVAT